MASLALLPVLLGEKRATCTFLNSKTRLSCQSYSQTFSISSCPENFTWTRVWTVDSFWGRNRNNNEAHVPSIIRRERDRPLAQSTGNQTRGLIMNAALPPLGLSSVSHAPPPYVVRQGLRASVCFSSSRTRLSNSPETDKSLQWP